MSYEKKKYGFNWKSFAWQLEGPMVRGCKYPPKCSFVPTGPDAKNPGIYFNGYYNHENMDKPASQVLSFDNFRTFLNIIMAVANAPGEEQIIKQMAFKFFKDKEFKHSGTSVGIVRNEQGLIYFAFKNKAWPTVPFHMLPHGSMEMNNKDGEADDVRFVSKMAAISWVERNKAMLDSSIEGAIELDSPSGGGYSNSGGSSSSSSSGGDSSPAAVDFDDDVPF